MTDIDTTFPPIIGCQAKANPVAIWHILRKAEITKADKDIEGYTLKTVADGVEIGFTKLTKGHTKFIQKVEKALLAANVTYRVTEPVLDNALFIVCETYPKAVVQNTSTDTIEIGKVYKVVKGDYTGKEGVANEALKGLIRVTLQNGVETNIRPGSLELVGDNFTAE